MDYIWPDSPVSSFLSPCHSPGYGNIAPSTEGGKIFCILYAIFGIPLFGFLLAGVGDQLGTIFVKSIAKVEKMFRVRNELNLLSLMSLCGNDYVAVY